MSMLIKQASIIEKTTHMVTARLGNGFISSNRANALSRVSWIAALKEGNLFAPMTFAGSCNRDLFEMWLEQCLLPQLQPGNVIVIDNATFHHGQAIAEMLAQVGCEIWYLPPYSPCCCFRTEYLPEKTADLNKIEHWWFVLKNWMRQRWSEFDSDARLC